MRESVTAAQLCLDGRGGFTYVVALMRYIVREDETFRYELEPNYEVIDLLDSSDFQGIPGFDLSARKTCYERDNRTPTLIADRAPMANREDLWSLLDECGMDYWDPLEWLVRSPRRYIGDKLYFRAVPEGAPGVLGMEEAVASAANSPQAVGSVLAALCAGDAVECEGEPLGGAERKVLYESFMLLHEKASRGRRAETRGGGPAARPGRRRKPVDELMLREAIARYRAHEWTAAKAAESIGVGEATFYRRMAEWEQREG